MSGHLRALFSPQWEANLDVDEPVTILLHRYGSDENDLSGIPAGLGLATPWASVRAPVDLGGGAAWFRMTAPGDPAEELVAKATDTLWE